MRAARACRTVAGVMLFVPLIGFGLVLTVAAAVVGLAAHGPLGWLAALLLVAGCGVGLVVVVTRTRRWWRSTKAPARPVRQRL